MRELHVRRLSQSEFVGNHQSAKTNKKRTANAVLFENNKGWLVVSRETFPKVLKGTGAGMGFNGEEAHFRGGIAGLGAGHSELGGLSFGSAVGIDVVPVEEVRRTADPVAITGNRVPAEVGFAALVVHAHAGDAGAHFSVSDDEHIVLDLVADVGVAADDLEQASGSRCI